ncbi:unnamed protein product [Ilex paraguariensis]|uniref:Rab-GAP TBC domain-containing protein n=1 Tax=Ilex paraguariensis TaxID=185542 RepID=A0ABC8UMT1_9AQUA
MSPVPIEPTLPESSSVDSSPSRSDGQDRSRFADLRGVQWRIDLGILPSSSFSSSIDDLRRVTADSRRKYAALRRQLLVDPHVPKDGSSSPDLVMDNPLSQNPDSMWGRFFRNAELERMVDQDLSRLYPERGSYFQTPGCQSMLRRILLLWCLRHPEYGYRQGMHELLAPLLYVLHVDVEHLSEVRKLYEDYFTDNFDGFSFHESDLTYKFDFKKFSGSMEDEIGQLNNLPKVSNIYELDPKVQTIVLLSDAYGAEGELGIVLSEKFMEHDAYCMFDALMNGVSGAVAMAEFFSPSFGNLHTGFPPVIEASSAFYHLLSIVDMSLHSHLVDLGVEPQYFALRWLRVLFGREFALEDLLIVWDEIFASDNSKLNRCNEDDAESSFGVLNSSRGAFISAFAVSMILYLRPSLLATENATSCLQRLLNFPEEINLKKLIAKAKSLQALAMEANNSTPQLTNGGAYERTKLMVVRGHSLSADSISPGTPLSLVPDSYWEEKWRVLHKEKECKQDNSEKQIPNRIKGWSEKVRLRLSRTESDPSSSKVDARKRDSNPSVRRSLLEDLARQLGLDETTEIIVSNEDLGKEDPVEVGREGGIDNNACTADERCLSGNAGSEGNSSFFSDPPTPNGGSDNHENELDRSSVASNSSADENDVEPNNADSCSTNPEESPLPISDPPEDISLKCGHDYDSVGQSATDLKEPKLPSGKFQWLWKFGQNAGEGTSKKGGASEATKASNGGNSKTNEAGLSTVEGFDGSSVIGKGETVDQNVMVTLRNLGQSMLENIQVIESVFQQDRGQVGSLENFSKNVLVGRGQVTAVAALKELRKISNLLSEM